MFKVEVIAENSGKWRGNGLTFPTQQVAEEYAINLMWRWMAVREWRVVPVPACPMCKYYTSPGWIINAWQVVPCFECNPGNLNGLDKPASLAMTDEGQATYEDRTRGITSTVDNLEDYK